MAVVSLLLGPRPPALSALWQTGGRRGVTAAVCTALPLAAGVALGRADLGSAAALAAFTSVYGHALPYAGGPSSWPPSASP
jgi:hypothetical protein